MSIPEILDEIERAELAAEASWPIDRLYHLWRQGKPEGTPDPEWYDPDDREEIEVDVDQLKALLREALAAEIIRARARGETTVVIDGQQPGSQG